MSKRHQSSRRKSYGRRQHELRERIERRRDHEEPVLAWDDESPNGSDPLGFLDRRASGLRLALGD